MTQDEIESALALTVDASTDHEDARDWYDSYGWHLSTEEAGDVVLQAVDYDWLDDADDAAVVALLLEEEDDLSQSEAESLVERARSVREAADSICSLLDDAVEAYERGDLEATRAALLDAYSLEIEHGDAPATSSLAGELLTDTVVRYRVYEAADGCDPIYCGEYDTLDEAEEAAEREPGGLPRALWDTARAAGHCGGMTAPVPGEEDEEPISWHGPAGWHCVVGVTYRSASIR